MVDVEHKPGQACDYLFGCCGKVAGFAIRARGTSGWFYACGYHVGRVVRSADGTGGGVIVEVIA